MKISIGNKEEFERSLKSKNARILGNFSASAGFIYRVVKAFQKLKSKN